MKYNLATESEVTAAFEYLTDLVSKHAIADIKKVSPKRSLNQNAYLHLIIGYFGVHFGYTLEEAKQLYKEINKDIYMYKKKNRVFFRSSADLSVDEMQKSIDRFRQRSAEAGCELPAATDKEWLRWVENEVERNNGYL